MRRTGSYEGGLAMKAIGAYRTTGGWWAAFDKQGRAWRVEEADGLALEAAQAARLAGGRTPGGRKR